MPNQIFKKQIKRLLQEHHEGKQVEMARKLGISQAGISKWLTTHTAPRHDTLEHIAKTYNVTIDWLLYGTLAMSGAMVNQNSKLISEYSDDPVFVHILDVYRSYRGLAQEDKLAINRFLVNMIEMFKRDMVPGGRYEPILNEHDRPASENSGGGG